MRRVAVMLLLMAGPLLAGAAARGGGPAPAVEGGDPAAQYAHAQTLEREGRPHLAFPWFLAAARQGHALAQLRVAQRFEDGALFPTNAAQAFRWYSLAAAAREPDAEFALGEAYEQGRGTTPSRPTALTWYARAADNPRRFRQGDGYTVPDGVLGARNRLRELCAASPRGADPEVDTACVRHAPAQGASAR
jgi:hypothetical protein